VKTVSGSALLACPHICIGGWMSMGDNSIDDMHGIMRTCTACGYRDMYRGGVMFLSLFVVLIGVRVVVCV
jgi:hypothetical protein